MAKRFVVFTGGGNQPAQGCWVDDDATTVPRRPWIDAPASSTREPRRTSTRTRTTQDDLAHDKELLVRINRMIRHDELGHARKLAKLLKVPRQSLSADDWREARKMAILD